MFPLMFGSCGKSGKMERALLTSIVECDRDLERHDVGSDNPRKRIIEFDSKILQHKIAGGARKRKLRLQEDIKLRAPKPETPRSPLH